MQLILTQERGDFDTIGAMLGAYLLHPDSILVLPTQLTVPAQALVGQYFHKLPFESAAAFQTPDGGWCYPLLSGLIFGLDFLPGLQIARQLLDANTALDPFFASIILLGIAASTHSLNSFSADQAVDVVTPYLLAQGADVDFVQEWLSYSGTELPQDTIPENVIEKLPANATGGEIAPVWQRLLEQVIRDAAHECGFPVYLVGGVVRDMLLGKTGRDLDFVVEGNAILLAKSLLRKFGGEITTHKAFGTASWGMQAAQEKILEQYPQWQKAELDTLPDTIDLITARSEWYPDIAQLPAVRAGRIGLDLRRRDFSVNSLALRLDSEPPELLDACHGYGDLKEGIIRALHPLSFRDDPTRLFRAVRYEQRLGFRIEPSTAGWMVESLPWVKHVSGDRLRHELNLVLTEEEPEASFFRMESLGILKAIHSCLRWTKCSEKALEKITSEPIEIGWQLSSDCGNLKLGQFLGYAVWLAEHTIQTVTEVCMALRFSRAHTQAFTDLCRIYQTREHLRNAANSVLVKSLETLTMECMYALDCLVRDDVELHVRLLEYRDDLRHVTAGINGETLVGMGIPPGKIYQEILTSLRDAWLDGVVHTPAEESELLWQMLNARGYPGDE